MRAAIEDSTGVSRRPSTNEIAAATDIRAKLSMLMSPTVTASDVSLRRAPWQSGHGLSDMYSSSRSF